MKTLHLVLMAAAVAVLAAIVPSVKAAGACCGTPAPAETKKCAACAKCGEAECKCTKPATTNACKVAETKAPETK